VPKAKEERQRIKELTLGEATKELAQKRRELFDLRLQQQRGELKNSRVFAQTRKNIARVLHRLTELGEE
jgi:large subunit ribosomal protein L29